MSERKNAEKLTEQQRDWERRVAAGKQGNPFATLCQHCFGRHAPPNDELCPYDPPSRAKDQP